MADILSQGRDRTPRRRVPPPVLITTGIVLLILALVLVHGLLKPHVKPRAAQSPSAHPAGPVTGRPAPFGGATQPRSSEPAQLAGLAVQPDATTPLLLTGPQPGWFWPAAGRFEPIGGLPRSRPGYSFIRVTDGWVLQSSSSATPPCQTCAGPPAPVYFVADGRAGATRAGVAYAASAADKAGAIWLTSYRPGADIRVAPGIVQEVTVAGRVLSPRYGLPPGYVIYRAVGGALLLAPYSQGAGPVTYELWDPQAGRVLRDFTNVLAASSEQIAWNPCAAQCTVSVLNLSTGTRCIIPLAPGTWAVGGTFSSDGRLLAVQVTAAVTAGYAAANLLDVIEIPGESLTVVPGTTVSSRVDLVFGWQSRTYYLLAFVSGSSTVVHVGSWRPGDAHLSIEAAKIPSGTSIVLGDR